jgi:hypothetical protein
MEFGLVLVLGSLRTMAEEISKESTEERCNDRRLQKTAQ